MYGIGTAKREQNSRVGSPGPGQYSHKIYVGKEGQKRCMIGARPNSAGTRTPGPGAYTPKPINLKENPKFGIGTELRGKRMAVLVPGPGQYNPSDLVFMKEPTWKIGTGARGSKMTFNGTTPGPGNYAPQPVLMQAPKFSMRLKTS